MKSLIKQVLAIVVMSALVGGVSNLIRGDRIPWISKPVSLNVIDPTKAGSRQANPPIPYPQAILLDAVNALHSDGAVIIDARLPEFYKKGHIPSAINIPFENLDPYLETLCAISKDDTVIVYCDGVDCELSHDLAFFMIQEGYHHLFVFQGGWEEWAASGLPVEGIQ
jgi:3-mercaptopyruvate sulfurtransferase SseA